MPTSKAQSTPSWAKRLVAILAALICFIVLNAGITLALEPYGNSTEVVWSLYRDASDEPIDTIIVGSSFAQAGIDPAALDSSLGSFSWTLATSAQSINNSRLSIKTAFEDHQIKRAIVGMSYAALQTDPYVNSGATFVQFMSAKKSLPHKMADYAALMFDPSFFSKSASLSCLFPWSYSNVGYSPTAIAQNIRNRIECATPLEAGYRWSPGWVYSGQGFYHVSAALDLTTIGNAAPPADDYVGRIHEPNFAAYQQLARYCAEQGIELYVVATPQPAFNYLKLGERYPTQMQRVQELLEAEGAHFLDFNMATDELYQLDYGNFNDEEHLNAQGAAQFSQILGQTIARIEAGDTLTESFISYLNWSKRLATLNHISVVGAAAAATAQGVEVDMWSYQDSDIEVQYEVQVIDDQTGAVHVVREYAPEPHCVIEVAGHGTLHIQVNARRADMPTFIERTCTVYASY